MSINYKIYLKMAKAKFQIVTASINGILANQEFNALRVTNQVGDRFYVPAAENLLVLGTEVPAMDRKGQAILNEKGEQMMRSVGQHFPAVRLLDGKPAEVVELYVGQVVKADYFGRIVFPGALSDALRKGSDAFKKEICNRALEIVEEKECIDRVWDQENNRWMRDAEDQTKLAQRTNRAFKFEAKASAMSAADLEKANQMLFEYYKSQYPDVVKEVE